MPAFERCVVLVVDDEPAVLRIVSLALTYHGYVVLSAPDGPSALRICLEREGPIDLALLDVVMPGVSGPKLSECLLQNRPTIEVLFMSGNPEGHDSAAFIERSHFIRKPFGIGELAQRVNTILGNGEVREITNDEAPMTLRQGAS